MHLMLRKLFCISVRHKIDFRYGRNQIRLFEIAAEQSSVECWKFSDVSADIAFSVFRMNAFDGIRISFHGSGNGRIFSVYN